MTAIRYNETKNKVELIATGIFVSLNWLKTVFSHLPYDWDVVVARPGQVFYL